MKNYLVGEWNQTRENVQSWYATPDARAAASRYWQTGDIDYWAYAANAHTSEYRKDVLSWALAIAGGLTAVGTLNRIVSSVDDVVVKGSSNVLSNTSRQLQAKFKHAGDFGVVGNYSKTNAAKFSSAINQHINSPGVQVINGTYRGQSVIHYVNPNTGLNVISNPSGQFISGWRLNSAQLNNVLKHGGL